MAISFLTLTKYCIAVGDFGFHLNAFFGPILIFLTIFGIKGQFGSYKKLLVNFQVIGFVFALTDFLSPTLLHTYNRTLVYFSLSHPFGLSNCSIQWMIAAYCGIFCSTLCLLAIQFLFRFWAVFDTKKLIYFDGFNYFIWILYYTFFGALWAYGVGHFFALDSYGIKYLSEEILEKYEKNISEIPILSLVSYDEEGRLRLQSLCGLSIITGISTVQYSIITVCAYKMYREMREKLIAMSPMQKRIHNQFYMALVLQTFAPSILLFSPVFFMLSIPYADLEISFPSSIFVSGFTLYPAVDSICIMYCVSEYGRCFRRFLSLFTGKIAVETPYLQDTSVSCDVTVVLLVMTSLFIGMKLLFIWRIWFLDRQIYRQADIRTSGHLDFRISGLTDKQTHIKTFGHANILYADIWINRYPETQTSGQTAMKTHRITLDLREFGHPETQTTGHPHWLNLGL